MSVPIQISRFRKKALLDQGLLQAEPFGRGQAAVLFAIRRLGYIQIDTISVVERAHHHVLWSRIPDYRMSYLDNLVEQKKIFEYWFHAASYLPIEDFRFALPRMQAIKSGEKHWFENTSVKLMQEIYRRIEVEGPLMARDFIQSPKNKSGWWDWKPAKQALEQMFIQGDLMIVGRRGFQKRYDLMERALPEKVDTRCPTLSEYAGYLVDVTIRAHGFAVLKSFTYLRKGAPLRQAVRERLQHLVDEGLLCLSRLPCNSEVYCDPAILELLPRAGSRVNILSPFDNSVIQRERCRSVFDFDFQIECYVPAAKRVFGYFCLPILSGDRFIGRVDCKADRKASLLIVKALYLDTPLSDALLARVVKRLQDFAGFNGCDRISIERAEPAKAKKKIQQLVKKPG